MIRTTLRDLGEYADQLTYMLLRMLVTWLAPATLQFDELDPILGAQRVPHAEEGRAR